MGTKGIRALIQGLSYVINYTVCLHVSSVGPGSNVDVACEWVHYRLTYIPVCVV